MRQNADTHQLALQRMQRRLTHTVCLTLCGASIRPIRAAEFTTILEPAKTFGLVDR
jgi:hypothetical protein